MKKDTIANIVTAIIIILAIVVTVIIVITKDAKTAQLWKESRQIVPHNICAGDTLNGLYYQYNPQGIDIGPWVEQVKELNNMSSSDIYVGDKLLIYVN
jgi:hypothetical protein